MPMSSRYRNAEYDRIRRSSSIELDERLSNDAANGKYNGKRSSSSSSRATSLDAFDPASDRMAFVKGAFDEDEKTQAARANEAETQMTLYEGLQKYPKAVAWSMVISTCIIMEGYDTALVSNFFGFPSFQKKYGVPYGNTGAYRVEAHWASILNTTTTLCTLIGLGLNGWAVERYGYRLVVLASLATITAFIFVPFFSPNMTILVIGEMLCSIPWGIFQTLTTAFASEICPVVLRCYLTTYVNMCWVIGIFIANGLLRILVTRQDEWGYRIPFALQWVWPVPLFIATLYAPESPWWLIREGRLAEAERTVRRLCSDAVDSHNTLAMMKQTDALERESAVDSSTSYAECFRGTNLRRTEIACMVWFVQIACGVTFVGWQSYFFQVAGLDATTSYSLSVVSSGLSFTGTIAAWVLLTYFGRRTLYMTGLSVMTVIFTIVGTFSFASPTNKHVVWATAILFQLFHLTYGLTIGPVCYTVVSEIPSTRLRAKTVIIARAAYIVGGLFLGAITPLMVQETGWNWKYKTGFFWAVSCALLWLWCYYRLPEPKGRSYGEMAVLFAKGVSAREFSRTVVDPFEAEDGVKLDGGGGVGRLAAVH